MMVPLEPDPEDSTRAEKQKPARRIRAKRSRSDIFKTSEDDADEAEEEEDKSPRKRKCSPLTKKLLFKILLQMKTMAHSNPRSTYKHLLLLSLV